MKKILLSILLAFAFISFLNAQIILHDNGPLVNYPGQGFGGADVSALETGIHNYGYNINLGGFFRMAEDFTVPPGETWNIDSLVFFAYQTNSTTASTLDSLNFLIWDGAPNVSGSTVIYGDTNVNSLEYSEWSGIYRTNVTFTAISRPVMRVVASSPGLVLGSGTYWVDWQASGISTLSGPWNPQITINGQLITGNALQFSPTAGAWQIVYGDTLDTYPQGMPFLVIGSVISGISETFNNSSVTVSPNPFLSSTVFNIDKMVLTGEKIYLNIYDVTGRIISQVKVNSTAVIFERGNLAKGVYSYELINSSGKIAIGRIVIQ